MLVWMGGHGHHRDEGWTGRGEGEISVGNDDVIMSLAFPHPARRPGPRRHFFWLRTRTSIINKRTTLQETERRRSTKREIMMAEEAQGDDEENFVYMGGNQRVPSGVRRARIHKSVKIIRARAFQRRYQLISVEFHDGVEIIEEEAFHHCPSLRGPMKLLGVKIVKGKAFYECRLLNDVEFGDKLETIERYAFFVTALKKIRMPSVRTVGSYAFSCCYELSDVKFGEALRTLQGEAFHCCSNLKWITLPLKGCMIEERVFDWCSKLSTVDLLWGTHNTVASLHMESWRSEINDEINRINQVLPTTYDFQKTEAMQQWIRTVIQRIDHYKAEHHNLMKEATTLLELALWKANLSDGGDRFERESVRTTRGSRKRARKEMRVTSGADVVIKNVFPFLALK